MGKRKKTIRNRILRLENILASDLVPHEKNWRTHDSFQRGQLKKLAEDIGWCGACIGYETPAGIKLIDGHMRAGLDPSQVIPVLILDIDDSEADKVLATFDPLGELAGVDELKLQELIDSLDKEILETESLIVEVESGEVELKQIDIKPPPRMSWCLIGLPTVRWSEISEVISPLAEIDGIILETTSNDGPAEKNGQSQPGGKTGSAKVFPR